MEIFINSLKAISKTETELRVGNYIILFGGRDLNFVVGGPNPDKSLGTRFAADCEVDSEMTKAGRFPIGWEHGKDPDEIGIEQKEKALGFVDWSTAKRDEKGVFVERVLDRRQKYVQFVEELLDAGLIGTSSEAEPNGIRALEDGTITRWPLRGDTLTVMPMEPRMMREFGGNTLQALKSLSEEIPAVKALLSRIDPSETDEGEGKGSTQPGGSAKPKAAKAINKPLSKKSITENKTMKLMDAIKKLVPGLTEEQYQAIEAILGLAGYDTGASAPDGGDGSAEAAQPAMMSLDITKLVSDLKALGYDAAMPGAHKAVAQSAAATERKEAVTRPPFSFTADEGQAAPQQTPAQKALEAGYVMRFGDEDAATKSILSDYIGADYRQKVQAQNVAFAKYLRGGERALDVGDVKALRQLYFPKEAVIDAVKNGASVQSVKATQVEAVGELGGYAVPPNVQSEVSRRQAGLTAVRGSGARVIQLVNSNGIEIPVYRGDSTKYMGVMRGQWGTETQVPTVQNFKLDMELVMAHIYTYKVPMSVSLLEDAANLIQVVEEDIASTKSIDEDGCFLVGDGVGKPRGILPGGINADSLTQVVSGAAAAFLEAGINGLKRKLPSQYRDKAKSVWVANSNSFGLIENLTVGTGVATHAFPELTAFDEIRGFRTFESESMPDVAANSFPLLFGNMGGYTIVERLGMTIERFKDSGTGPNVVEFHVRARVGGRVEKPWMFAVQKIAAS
jgi:HK97 family phage major capsid protein